MIGPPRRDASWQARTARGFTAEAVAIDWDKKRACCPQGQVSSSWRENEDDGRGAFRNCHLQGVPVAIALHPFR